jgi:kynurenine formamidase
MGKEVLVDLSHPFGQGTPLWPSGGDFYILRINYMQMHYRLLQTFNNFHMHNSTHADSPAHVIPEGAYTHEISLDKYYGEAVVVSIPKGKWELITPEELEAARPEIREGDIVIINTGTHKRFGENDDYFMYSPGLSIDAAKWLVAKKVKALGIDCQALDHPCYTYMIDHGPGPFVPRLIEEYTKLKGHPPIEDFPEWEPVHTILLGNDVMGFENVGGDIEMVTGRRCKIAAFPLRWYKGDGTIVRMVAFIDEDELVPGVEKREYKWGVY